MKLEEAIGQTKPFKSPKRKLMVNLFFTHNWLINELKNFLKQYGITNQQYNILRILRGAKKPISTSIIRERMIDKMSDTTRLINRMVKKSLVSKVTCSSDKRLVDVQITDIGLSLLSQIELNMTIIDDKLETLEIEECEVLNDLLDKLRN